LGRPSHSPTPIGGVEGAYEIYYQGYSQHRFQTIDIAEGHAAKVDLIDTWAMTIETLPEAFSGQHRIELPVRPYVAYRLRIEATAP
jgi:hypothetical protein